MMSTLSPSPGTPGEGWGEGLLRKRIIGSFTCECAVAVSFPLCALVKSTGGVTKCCLFPSLIFLPFGWIRRGGTTDLSKSQMILPKGRYTKTVGTTFFRDARRYT